MCLDHAGPSRIHTQKSFDDFIFLMRLIKTFLSLLDRQLPMLSHIHCLRLFLMIIGGVSFAFSAKTEKPHIGV